MSCGNIERKQDLHILSKLSVLNVSLILSTPTLTKLSLSSGLFFVLQNHLHFNHSQILQKFICDVQSHNHFLLI